MIEGVNPVTQALLGTLFTWGLTAAGAGLVVFLRGKHRKTLDASLGFSSGVMIAASFWSLLNPAIELAESSGLYGSDGRYAFVPVAIGFLMGAVFVYLTDKVITYLGINSASMMIQLTQSTKDKADIAIDEAAVEHGNPMIQVGGLNEHSLSIGIDSFADCLNNQHSGQARKRKKTKKYDAEVTYDAEAELQNKLTHWKRIILLIAAVTIHNIPEGLAVGVSFGAIGSSSKATFEAARNLAIGIGIQNFPEGLAVSLPLHSSGISLAKSFWYGQLSFRRYSA
jgi:zinc transporter 11